MHLSQLGPLREGNRVPAKSCVPEAREGSPGKLPTTHPQVRDEGEPGSPGASLTWCQSGLG